MLWATAMGAFGREPTLHPPHTLREPSTPQPPGMNHAEGQLRYCNPLAVTNPLSYSSPTTRPPMTPRVAPMGPKTIPRNMPPARPPRAVDVATVMLGLKRVGACGVRVLRAEAVPARSRTTSTSMGITRRRTLSPPAGSAVVAIPLPFILTRPIPGAGLMLRSAVVAPVSPRRIPITIAYSGHAHPPNSPSLPVLSRSSPYPSVKCSPWNEG